MTVGGRCRILFILGPLDGIEMDAKGQNYTFHQGRDDG
jgi:hypothetical protein